MEAIKIQGKEFSRVSSERIGINKTKSREIKRFLRNRIVKSSKKFVYFSKDLKKVSIWLESYCSRPLVLRNMKIQPFL